MMSNDPNSKTIIRRTKPGVIDFTSIDEIKKKTVRGLLRKRAK
jgi:hypothetical protein